MGVSELRPAPRVTGNAALVTKLLRRRLIQRIRQPRGLTGAELGVCSQNGEDGVIHEIFRRIGAQARYFVEFGVGEGEQGNCVLLADRYRWRGLFMEADPAAYSALEAKYESTDGVATSHARVTADNIDLLLTQARVPQVFDLLSIDTDGNDYWIWRAIQAFRPRVVVVEYNGNLPLDRQLVMPRDDGHAWDGTDYFGASLAAYRILATSKSYRLVHTDRTGTNAFFVNQQEADPFEQPPQLYAANYFRRGIRLPRDPQRRPFLDLETGLLVQADRQR